MKKKTPLSFFVIAVLAVLIFSLLSITSAAHSLDSAVAFRVNADQAGERASEFTLTRSVIGSGGLGGSTDKYTFNSTLGQPVAGAVDESIYHLTSGFWTEVIELIGEFLNYLPLIVK